MVSLRSRVVLRIRKGAIMLITFQSTASPDVVMLRDLAQYLLGLIGKRLGERGVIMRDELPAAINRVESAITEDATVEVALEALHCSPGNRRSRAMGFRNAPGRFLTCCGKRASAARTSSGAFRHPSLCRHRAGWSATEEETMER
jgi:hypothetical protein